MSLITMSGLVLEGMYQQGFVRRFRIATAVSPPQP
jgi:hypothetical protein